MKLHKLYRSHKHGQRLFGHRCSLQDSLSEGAVGEAEVVCHLSTVETAKSLSLRPLQQLLR